MAEKNKQNEKIEKIPGVELSELVTEATSELLAERRKKAAGLIKNHLQRVEGLALDVRKKENELKKLREKLTKAQAKIDKIKAGDWSVLSDRKDGPKGHNNGPDESGRALTNACSE